ncbi:mitochondrial malic enzyme [Emiliania huxleyi CCMP1516]|uniref:Malic enzyme n=2 Tax=Emiliania huxleyi TaxID=2903 RepID=A0A0D3IA48_EMIH1|nr:mitochondrial malic enzyme [Emiliania huxleyi CCMP1516]EOD08133.1 mitochondrial malic enzyme [Emiliania huxleyi CCMP1516]|eukprot:XP_005760562.1 mitochondrial malic enzyme [Emiliania huxleyi CCMP1516]
MLCRGSLRRATRFGRLTFHRAYGDGTDARARFLKPLDARHSDGWDILNNPLWNKGTAFTWAERERLGLRGLLPAQVRTIEEQVSNFVTQLSAMDDQPLMQNLMLQDLQARNETLYHRVLVDHVEKMAPLVYTPTVGAACQHFSSRYQRSRGMFFTPEDAGEMGVMMRNWPRSETQVVVVTDGSRILGLGDLGANGMGIPIGKLALYCAVGGIAPHRVLPVMLDFGTNNESLLRDPLYRGYRQPRALVDEFVRAVFSRFPNVLLQWEDFSSDKASNLLAKYRENYLCFNDDIQGTGATVLAGVLGALRLQRRPPEDIRSLRVAVVGAGSAGIGVAQALHMAMQQAGLSAKAAYSNFYILDQDGLQSKARFSSLTEEQMAFARADLPDGMALEEVVEQAKPHLPHLVLGLSGKRGTISEAAIRKMAAAVERPIVMPLSNPTSSCEITPEEAYEWSDGRAIVATGSPFEPVALADGSIKTPSQCNNMYIFPGIGLGASICQSETIPDSMLYESAVALSRVTDEEEMARGSVFPSISKIRQCSHAVAVACIRHAHDLGIAKASPGCDHNRGETYEQWVTRKMYYPEYAPIYTSHTR